MNTSFIDTNIFLEAYLRSGKESEKCQELLKSDKNLFTTWLIIGELEWVLRSIYKLKRGEIYGFLGSVIGLDGLDIPDKKTLVKALKMFKDLNVDWVDCMNVAIVKNMGQNSIYSYDRDFDKFSEIKRLEP